jgi:protein-tyrosine kinase
MSGNRTSHLIERAVEQMAQRRAHPSAPIPPASRAPVAGDDWGCAGDVPQDQVMPDAPPPVSSRAAPDPITVATLEAAGLAVAGPRRTRISDEWRVASGQLLSRLRAAPARDGCAANLLMVTSSKPDEGKSFCALNLACSLTLGGLTEVVLMDVDSKPVSLSALLGLAEHPGLFDLVADPSLRPEDLVLPTAIAGLSILPIGRAVDADGGNSVGRTVTRPVAVMVEKLARHFSNKVVVLDAAPSLATSDVSSLAPSVGQIVMIVEAERTQHEDLEAALELLRPCPNITLVLNKIRFATKHAFGHSHYYDA